MRTSKLVVPLVIGVLALACGGATDATSLFGPPASSADAGHTGSSSGGGSGGGSGSSSGGGSGSSSGSSSGGGSGSGSSSSSSSSSSSGGSSGGGSGSSSGSSSGGGSGSSSGSSSGGSSSGGTDPGIYCGKSSVIGGNTYCPVGSDACCAKGSGPTTMFKCESASSQSCANGGGVAILCDNGAECPSQLCCGSLDTSTDTYVSVQCQATCDPLQNQYIFCDPNAATDICATVPANGGTAYTCKVSTVLPGFYRCSQ